GGCPLDFSFSGSKSSVDNILHKAEPKNEEITIKDLGAPYIISVVDCLERNTSACLDITKTKKLVLAGGVAANSVLRKRIAGLCAVKNVKLYIPPPELCTDNAVMVAAQGYFEYLDGNIADLTLNGAATKEIES
ncbi:MAG: tRNA (adenosine(37)-N6)-threonylcarbamoyltransferase complex transferase subunit TsaD, partial [Oscillospiraceae bacterium]|nr:tRNA (adenosine(37)-N6)-threonylcarbamoyltransferase complex transferase subunit TsaD [Oscillospiraceae bacterium]